MREKDLREKFHEARQAAFDSGRLSKTKQNDGVYTPQMLWALRDMAQNDAYPDGSFSDMDCNVWMMFR